MNSALKPVLPTSAPQNPPVAPQLNKPMQSTPASYGQASSHMPQSLVNIPHNPTVAHTLPNSAHQSNHYSLNVPNASQHYSPSNIPASNHPVASVGGGQTYSPNKSTAFGGGYQPNLGHPPNNPMPPVTQTLPATQSLHTSEASPEKPQSNGTPEVKSPAKAELPENHVDVKEKSPVPEEKPESPVEGKEEESKETNKPDRGSPSVGAGAPSVESAEETSAEKKEEAIESDGSSRETTEQAAEEEKEVEKAKENKEEKNSPKAATPKTPTRKSKTPKLDGDSPRSSKDAKSTQKSPNVGTKSKRTRIKTQPYQSPLPEIEIITKISSSTPRNKANDDKVIVFYKNEFLAVRNSEGSFYICQAVQNIYKSSPRIRIRWLSQEKSDKSGEIYAPDFYDNTDFDCILTNLNLTRVEKGKYRLPPAEKERTDSILKRSLAVEKGEVTSPSLTEEHPDGIDVSLYKEDNQLKKRKGTKRRATSALRSGRKAAASPTKSPEEPKVRKVVKVVKKAPKKVVKPKETVEVKKASTSRTDRAKRRSNNQNSNKVSPVVDQKKAKVLAKVARKTTKSQSKAKSAKAAAPKASKAPKKTKRTKK